MIYLIDVPVIETNKVINVLTSIYMWIRSIKSHVNSYLKFSTGNKITVIVFVGGAVYEITFKYIFQSANLLCNYEIFGLWKHFKYLLFVYLHIE